MYYCAAGYDLIKSLKSIILSVTLTVFNYFDLFTNFTILLVLFIRLIVQQNYIDIFFYFDFVH